MHQVYQQTCIHTGITIYVFVFSCGLNLKSRCLYQCAFEGKGFMYSAMRAYGLISRNIFRVAVVSVVGSLSVFIG